MSGRGCTITINVLGGSSANGLVEDIRLPVALHSPLEVLRHQLVDLIGIPYEAQVLILLNLSDPERNSDVLLIGRDHESLSRCGIKNASVLTLHALGLSAELKQKMTMEALSAKSRLQAVGPTAEKTHCLATPIGADEANHSFNGVIFDVMCKSPYEIDIVSISIAGMLGRIRIFVRDRPWEVNRPSRQNQHNWFGHSDGVDLAGWVKVADIKCRPSWDRPTEVMLDSPIRMLPNTIRGFYCHSSLPDDLGIQYQSYGRNDIVAEDSAISIHPGLGHTGNVPFDETNGWYRSFRGPAGSIQYKRRFKGWSLSDHQIYPVVIKDAVKQTLACNTHLHLKRLRSSSSMESTASSTSHEMISTDFGTLPLFIVYNIFEYMNWDWFVEMYEDYEDVATSTIARYRIWKNSHNSPDPVGIPVRYLSNNNSSAPSRESSQTIELRRSSRISSLAARMASAMRSFGLFGNSSNSNLLEMITHHLSDSINVDDIADEDDDDQDEDYMNPDDDEEEDGHEEYPTIAYEVDDDEYIVEANAENDDEMDNDDLPALELYETVANDDNSDEDDGDDNEEEDDEDAIENEDADDSDEDNDFSNDAEYSDFD